MEKYNWKDDTGLLIALADKGRAPAVVTGPKFDSQYKFVIQKHNGRTEVKKFVPEWGLQIVCSILDKDETVKRYSYERTYKGKTIKNAVKT